MYDLATIKRLNDQAALKAQYPEHDCAEEVLYNPEYESFGDQYVDRDEHLGVIEDRRILAGLAQEYANLLRSNGEEWDARDVEARIKTHTHA